MKKVLYLIFFVFLFYACVPNTKRTVAQGRVLPAVEDVVMYEVNPRIFAPQQSFNAIATRLDSIQGLGVNVLWLMPIYEIGQVNTVNSPYCIRDYRKVNPEFGTMEDFERLVELCHERGMAVVLDWVANHTS